MAAVSPQGYYNGNALDGDYLYLYLTWTQSGNSSTVSWIVGWAFRNPSPTDRQINNGYFDAAGVVRWDNGGTVHPNRGQYYEHEENFASGSFVVGHDAAGYATFDIYAEAYPYYNNNFNTRSQVGRGTLTLPRIPKAPGKPPTPVLATVDPVTTTAINYTFANPADNGGSTLTTFNHQSATDAGFTQNVQNWNDPSTPGQAATLTPGTTHYVRYRAVNAIGAGPWSDALSASTIPAVAPGFSASTSASGTSATLTFSAPGGVSGVTKYTWERRLKGTTTPVTTGETAATTATVGSLTPGTTYEWRASAWIGTYQSPWTGWLSLTQAKPNINPGDYFDGATPTPAGGDLDYQWGTTGTGAANASISTAVAVGVDGWDISALPPGAAAVMYRITGGVASTHAARVQVTADATSAAGLRMGQKSATGMRSAIAVGGTYLGSIYVKLSRSQNMAAEITWVNAAGTQVGSRVLGAAMVVPSGTWTRLTVPAVAPTGATEALVRVIDVTGTGWSTFKGGDIIDLDAAMISLNELFPYFDGATAPNSTFVYEWVDPAKPHKSTSKRTPIAQVESATLSLPDGLQIGARALLDPNCLPPAPPRPPTIPSDCITEAGVWARKTQALPASMIPEYLDVVPTFEITTLSSALSQVRIRIYPNPDSIPAGAFDSTTGWISEQIISYVPKNTVLTIDGVHQRVHAEVAGSGPIAADHLLYGSKGTPATWPVLSCGIDYIVTADLPTNVPQADSNLHVYTTTRY